MTDTIVLLENAKLRIEMRIEGTTVTLRPVGQLDEDLNFSVVLSTLGEMSSTFKMLQFDLGYVTGLNSCGVREWLMFIEKISPFSTAFLNVNEIFIDQANMIQNLFGKKGTPVLSFQAPYHCPECNAEVTMLLEPAQVKFQKGIAQPPVFNCQKCSTALDFDSLEGEYFTFIKRLRESIYVGG